MNLDLKKITGFSCNDSVIEIKSKKNGKTLYWFDNQKRKEITFNVLGGIWTTQNKLKELKNPLVYVCPSLPYKTVNRKVKPFKYRVGDNPNKTTIDFDHDNFADVFIDHEIDEQEIPHFVFVMFHENGHFKYGGLKKDDKDYIKNESYCDCYAAKKMLEKGFNPSQCLFAIEMCLSESDSSRERKDLVFNWLKKVKIK